MRRALILAFVISACAATAASAGMTTLLTGQGAAGGGTFTPSFLLVDTGVILLVDTGNKMEIHP